jgi:hypothetical protein
MKAHDPKNKKIRKPKLAEILMQKIETLNSPSLSLISLSLRIHLKLALPIMPLHCCLGFFPTVADINLGQPG